MWLRSRDRVWRGGDDPLIASRSEGKPDWVPLVGGYRTLADRLAHAPNAGITRHDAGIEQLRERLTALQVDLERRLRKGNVVDADPHKTRRLIDETQARLESRMLGKRDGQTRSRVAIPESREEVQAALPADTAVLAYFVGDRRSHAWLLTRTELRHSALPGRRALQDLVNTFVERQRSGVKTVADAAFAPLLGNLLNGVSSRRLLILPDGPLNGLPFAALPMPHGQPREILIDRFVIAAAPSLASAAGPSASTGPGGTSARPSRPPGPGSSPPPSAGGPASWRQPASPEPAPCSP